MNLVEHENVAERVELTSFMINVIANVWWYFAKLSDKLLDTLPANWVTQYYGICIFILELIQLPNYFPDSDENLVISLSNIIIVWLCPCRFHESLEKATSTISFCEKRTRERLEKVERKERDNGNINFHSERKYLFNSSRCSIKGSRNDKCNAK